MKLRDVLGVFRKKALNAVPFGSGGSWTTLFSSTAWDPSAWQADDHRSVDTAVSNAAVFACVTLIASDIGKLRPRLAELKDGIWQETYSPAFSPVLRKPNRHQNHIQFKEAWMTSKLLRGNAYALKERDQRGVVTGLYLLDPQRVMPLVAPNGDVYYQLSEDDLAGVFDAQIIVPASEIIHDRMNCLFHPLVGLSPLFAAAATADQGLKIQNNSTAFFGNASRPGGILVAPGPISQQNAEVLKGRWNANYTGANAGRIAVLGDGMKFEAMRMSAVESQLIEQMNMSAQVICSAFHVPPFMIGLGSEPTYSNGETRTSHYYSQCLQSLIESIEECLDDGLGLLGSPKDGRTLGVELDLAGLMRMDTKSHYEALTVAIKGGLMAPNEGRRQINLPSVEGGDTIFMQEQNYSLAALSNRPPPDAKAPAREEGPTPEEVAAEEAEKELFAERERTLQAKRIEAERAEVAYKSQREAQEREAKEHADMLRATAHEVSDKLIAQAKELTDMQRAAAAEQMQGLSEAAKGITTAVQSIADAVQGMSAQREALEAAASEVERKQLALDGSRDVALALIRKFTGAKHDA